MINSIEKSFEIKVNHIAVTLGNVALRLGYCLMGRASRAKAVAILGTMTALTGTTIGKSILRIRVSPTEPTGLGFHLGREFSVWAAGLGTGFPIAAPFTLFFQYRLVDAGKPASYDRGRATVTGKPTGFRFVLVVAAAIALLASISYFVYYKRYQMEALVDQLNRYSNQAE